MNYSKGQNDSIVKDFQAGKFYLFKANVSIFPLLEFTLSCEPTTPNPELDYSWSVVPKFIYDAIDEVRILITIKDGTVAHFTRSVLPDNDRYSIHFVIRFEWEKKSYGSIIAEKELIEKLNGLIASHTDRSHVINPVKEIEALFTYITDQQENKMFNAVTEEVIEKSRTVLEKTSLEEFNIKSVTPSYFYREDNTPHLSSFTINLVESFPSILTKKKIVVFTLKTRSDFNVTVEEQLKTGPYNEIKLVVKLPWKKEECFNGMAEELSSLIQDLNSGVTQSETTSHYANIKKTITVLLESKKERMRMLDLHFVKSSLDGYLRAWESDHNVTYGVGVDKTNIFADTYSCKVTVKELNESEIENVLAQLQEKISNVPERKRVNIFHITLNYSKAGFVFDFSYYYGD